MNAVPPLVNAVAVFALLVVGLVLGVGAAVTAPTVQIGAYYVLAGQLAAAVLAVRVHGRLGDSDAAQRRHATQIGVRP